MIALLQPSGAPVFVKMFQSIYDGSLATRGPWEALVTFQQMLILCDRTGMVDMTADVISRRTIIPLEIITKGIAVLEQPDPESRRGAEEGRRIVRLDPARSWGWQIVNYAHYRSLRTADDRREYMKQFMREKRGSKETEIDPPDETPREKFELPEWVPIEPWAAWLSVRKKKRAPNTPHALKLSIAKLRELEAQGHAPTAVLEQSIQRGYTGLFPLKSENPNHAMHPVGGNGGPPWWSTDRGIEAKGLELGMSARAGESWNEFKGRINEKLGANH